MQNLDQVALRLHHGIDRLVGHRCLVDDLGILPALHRSRRLRVILERETPPRLAARHGPPGAMAAAAEALRIAPAPDDIRTSAHAAGDDPEIPLSRPDGALPGDQYVL